MSSLTQKIIDKLYRIEQLAAPKLTEILELIINVERDLEIEKSTKLKSQSSCFELTSHLIGIGDDLPEDLSTNPDHMAGYGL